MDSTVLLGVIILTLAFIGFGLLTKYKIMLLIAVGGVVTIMLELISYVALVIVLVGLMIFLVWFATIGSYLEGK